MFNTSCYSYFSLEITLVGLAVATVRSAICLTRLAIATIGSAIYLTRRAVATLGSAICLAGRPPYSTNDSLFRVKIKNT